MFSTLQSLLWTASIYVKTIWSTFYEKIIWSVVTDAKPVGTEQCNEPNFSSPEDVLAQIKAIRDDHETAGLLQHLIETDGAGNWPPQASHGDAWPTALRPYHNIYLELAPSFPAREVSLDNEINFKRCLEYRTRMRKLLHDRIDLPAVKAILLAVEAGDESAFPADAYNGFFACIALSRHAFRWGTIPIVKLAQKEKFIDLPLELELPWPFLRRRFGITSQGGNLTSNFMCNFDKEEQIVYEINCGMPEIIKSAEYHFAHVFPAMEKLALPIYYNMIQSIICFGRGQRDTCLDFLKTISAHIRYPLKVYYDGLVESKIPRSVWMSYVQGFQAWGAGEIIDGVYVEYDAVSGNQLPLFHLVDAFLGLDPYLNEENMFRYIPLSQRELSASLRKHSFRDKAKLAGDFEIESEMEKILKQIRVFRVTHRKRARPYLSVPAPERMIMTAGKSVLESITIPNIKEAIEFLDIGLVKRLKETV